MTRAQLLAVATAIGTLAAGTVVFLRGTDSGDLSGTVLSTGMLQALDLSACTASVCNAPACTQAKNELADAGSPCTVGFESCSFRIGQRARDLAADAGTVLGPQTYQRLKLVGMRCAVDGGFTYAIPVDDNGWPLYAVSQDTPPCVRAPLDGGSSCLRTGVLPDGGAGFFGTGNVFPAAQAAGSNCDRVECGVFYGDDPDMSL